jgi:hypothetical protein
MSKVSRIDWTFFTSGQEGSGTDSEVSLEIYRDGNQIIAVDDEPGETARLDRGEVATRYWQFRDPNGLGVAVSGTTVPYTEDFPNGVEGHLMVRIRIHGDDAWRKQRIESNVWSGELRGVPGTLDSVQWVETPQHFVFSQEVVLSTNNAEGYTTWDLRY